MKVSCVCINTNILLGKEQDKIIEFLSKKLLDNGATISKIVVAQTTPEQIKDALNSINDNFVFIIGDKNSAKNYNIKGTLSRYFGVSLVQNQQAIQTVANFYKKFHLEPQIDCENEHYLPNGAELLKCGVSPEQGFMFTNNKTYIFLPNNLQTVTDIFNNHIIPILVRDVKAIYQTVTIKTFGINERDILYQLQELFNNKYKILITTYPKNLEVSINVRYNKNIDKTIIQSFIARIYEKLKKYTFTNEDISIYQMATDLLKIANKKIAIGETITNGNLTTNFLQTGSNAINLFTLGSVAKNVDSIVKNFKVSKALINTHKLVSVEVAYEMATNLLSESGSDLVVCTCGEWESDNVSTCQLVCYIAVGDNDGIHVYKNTYSGEYNAVIDNICKGAMFYLIKKIKQNDLFFSQTTV